MISILLHIIGRYLSIITKSSACGTISCFKMTTGEMNIISQPGHQGWPGLTTRPGRQLCSELIDKCRKEKVTLHTLIIYSRVRVRLIDESNTDTQLIPTHIYLTLHSCTTKSLLQSLSTFLLSALLALEKKTSVILDLRRNMSN